MMTEEGAALAQIPLKNKHVVMAVDDERPVLSALRRLLWREPYDLVTAYDPKDALRLMRERAVDLVLADQRMPGMSGMELCKTVNEVSPTTRCLMLTAYPESVPIDSVENRAVDALVTKPWDDEELRRTIRELLRRREAAEPRQGPRDLVETWLEMDCADRLGAELLRRIQAELVTASARDRGIAVHLANLPMLADPVVNFFDELGRRVHAAGVPVSILDPSSFGSVVAEVLGHDLPFLIYGPDASTVAGKQILIVDAKDESAEIMGKIATSLGHQYRTARTAAMAKYRLDSDPYDLMLIDFQLGMVDGTHVVEHLRARRLPCRVAAVSNYLEAWDDATYEQLDIRKRVWKPYRVKDIVDAIRGA